VTGNRVELRATLVARDAIRYSPAGVPILNADLAHVSEQREAGAMRRIEFGIATIFAGPVALAADTLKLGSQIRVDGFIATRRRNSKQLVLHVNEFELIEV
jgi:primosomal replication protein N